MVGNATCYDSTLSRAAEATARLKTEIDGYWRDSVIAHDGVTSDRLVAASQAIHTLMQLLDEDAVIG
jgi:hypothetical protein